MQAIHEHRVRVFHILPLDILVHILHMAFDAPYAFHTPALGRAAAFLGAQRRQGLAAWLGDPTPFASKARLRAILLQAEPLARRLTARAHLFLATVDGARRFAIGLVDDGRYHGRCSYVNDVDLGPILATLRSGRPLRIEARRSELCARYRAGDFADYFTLGIDMNGYVPIHVVSSDVISAVSVRPKLRSPCQRATARRGLPRDRHAPPLRSPVS